MAVSYAPVVVCVAVTILVALGFVPVKGGVRVVNQCPFDVTVFWQSQAPGDMQQVYLPKYTNQQLNLPFPWVGGVLWASQTANPNNAQATQLEFNIGPARDFYDVSVVNAYNLPAMINPTYLANGDVRAGLECGTISCVIPNLNAVCALNNFFAGPDPCCVNADGPGLVMTPGIQLFYDQCPSAYVLSDRNTFVVNSCNTGSQYDAIWCP